MILRILICSLLALTAINALAGNLTIYKDKEGKLILNHANPSGNSNTSNKKVTVNHYSNSNTYFTSKKVDRNKYLEMALEEVNPSTDVKKVDRNKYLEMADK